MKVVRKKSNGKLEFRVMEAGIVSDDFLKKYVHIHRPELLTSPAAKWTLDECVKFYKQFGHSPGKKAMSEMLRSASKGSRIGDDQAKVVGELLRDVQDGVPVNDKYLHTKVVEYFGVKTYKELVRKLQVALDKEDVKLCEQAMVDTKAARVMEGSVINPLRDRERVIEAFERQERPLFRVPGAFGRMLTPQMKRSRMVAFLARAKAGKTWMLYKLSMMAKLSGLNVAVFAAGDEDEESSILRYGAILTGGNPDRDFCGKFAAPVIDCLHNRDGDCNKTWYKKSNNAGWGIDEEVLKIAKTPEDLLKSSIQNYKACSRCMKKGLEFAPVVWYEWKTVNQIGWREAWKAFKRFDSAQKGRELRLFTYANDTLNVGEMERVLDVTEDNEGWVADVVVVDYPDIMKDEMGNNEFRHKENKKWKSLRRFNQERNNLLLLVSQSNRAGLDRDSLGADNVNEDRRKLDHVTAMYAINQTAKEKRMRTARIGPIVQRKGKFDVGRQVCILQFLEGGQPWRDSFWVWKEEEEEKKKES